MFWFWEKFSQIQKVFATAILTSGEFLVIYNLCISLCSHVLVHSSAEVTTDSQAMFCPSHDSQSLKNIYIETLRKARNGKQKKTITLVHVRKVFCSTYSSSQIRVRGPLRDVKSEDLLPAHE